MQKVAVVIPTHKEELDDLEQISLAQCRKVLGHYPIIYVIPEGKNFSWIPEGSQVIHMPLLGQGTRQYCTLLKSPQFYEPFLDYEYTLTYHVDAFVFYDALEYFCSLGYDYIGAPWSNMNPFFQKTKISVSYIDNGKISRVGNSGFCLRKTKTTYDLLTNNLKLAQSNNLNDDVFFSMCGKRADLNYNVAPYDVACTFAAEIHPSRVIKKNGGHFPFGCHKWYRYNVNVFVPFFLRVGYDLRPLKNKLLRLTLGDRFPQGLCEVATKRLIRRVKHGQELLKYLPTNRFASVRVLKSPDAEKILESIKGISSPIFFYDDLEALTNALTAEEPRQDTKYAQDEYMTAWLDTLNDLTVEETPHLVITMADEAPLLAALDKAGLSYGKHVISLRQEYFNHCEKIFHKLGK